jgi:hypothetical protein
LKTTTAAVAGPLLSAATALAPEALHAARAVAAHVVGGFREPVDYQQAATGQQFVFDRRDHTLSGLDEDLSIAFSVPYACAYDRDGAKVRALQLRGAGTITTSLACAPGGRLFVAPGPYAFDVGPRRHSAAWLRVGPDVATP